MELIHRHDWNLTPNAAVQLQRELGAEIIHQPLALETLRYVAGVDVSVKDGLSQAAVVVLTYPGLEVVETVTASQPTPFPYIPGLLSFREGPVLETAFQQLQTVPDVFLFDGMGIMHPRRLGIAAHLGLWLNRPTIGCGKTHFVGDYAPPGENVGDYSLVTHRGEIIGAVLRTRVRVKPVYISAGHLADLPTALQVVRQCTPKYRLPEPIRQAHRAAALGLA